jgi:hypothetical protein
MALFVLPYKSVRRLHPARSIVMKVEPEVTFRNLQPIPWIEADIRRRAARLSSVCPDMISFRVLVEISHRHQRAGRRFHVRIDIAVPGDTIVVSHAPDLRGLPGDLGETMPAKRAEFEAPRKDARLVIGEAFDIAHRQLRDYARLHRGAVKVHTPARRRRAKGAAVATMR